MNGETKQINQPCVQADFRMQRRTNQRDSSRITTVP